MTERFEQFVRHMEKQCGEEPSFVVLLKYTKKNEAIERILRNTEMILDKEIIKRVKQNETEISLYKTGKIIIKGIEKEKKAQALLNEVLKK